MLVETILESNFLVLSSVDILTVISLVHLIELSHDVLLIIINDDCGD